MSVKYVYAVAQYVIAEERRRAEKEAEQKKKEKILEGQCGQQFWEAKLCVDLAKETHECHKEIQAWLDCANNGPCALLFRRFLACHFLNENRFNTKCSKLCEEWKECMRSSKAKEEQNS